ncbi:CBS domain-containing protein [Tenggerimyces flavus]|uniref:CBS domain-containing protein n=1 Tax=Tenggerimyces flavus TaxID=1708749 RepID=A0ABV7YS76_9ACTN|nr:CBS domain-containing protein [Tenggerimyces flavus]MBM7786519.1 signal-transduction protein with cAMP-binding, CBS, and nucleotidyltransferase domain [Tenggerimyces flavus]
MTVQTVGDVMTAEPVRVPSTATSTEAARKLRDHNIGDVLVVDDEALRGIITDRDLAVRIIAEGRDPDATIVGEVCSSEVVTVTRPRWPSMRSP